MPEKGSSRRIKAGWICQAACNLHAPPFAAGKCKTLCLADMSKAQLRDQAFRPLAPLLPCTRLCFHHGQDVVLDCEFTKYGRLLGEVADAVLAGTQIHRQARDVGTIHHDSTRIRPYQTHNHVKGGRLARAIGSKKTNDLALANLQADAADHLPATVCLSDLFCRNQRRIAAISSPFLRVPAQVLSASFRFGPGHHDRTIVTPEQQGRLR